jgi:hypothetical protein
MPDTLKSICDQCLHLNTPRLDFISEELARNRQVILRDLGELISAASGEREKTVVVLSGSILEAVLFTFIQGQAEYIAERRGSFQFDPDQSLQHYVNLFNRWFRDVLPNAVIPDFMVGYRDLVHISRELASPPEVCTGASRELLRMLDAVLGELSQFASPAPADPVRSIIVFLQRLFTIFCGRLRGLLLVTRKSISH